MTRDNGEIWIESEHMLLYLNRRANSISFSQMSNSYQNWEDIESVINTITEITPRNQLHSFVKNGVIFEPNAVNASIVNSLHKLAESYEKMISNKVQTIQDDDLWREIKIREGRKDLTFFKKQPLGQYRIATAVNSLNNLIEFYHKVLPNNVSVELVSSGFFISEPGNLGQQVHCDSYSEDPNLPKVITVAIAVTDAKYNEQKTEANGPLRVQLGSHVLDYDEADEQNARQVLLLNKGDLVLWGGNVLHNGMPHSLNIQEKRVLFYWVCHVMNDIEREAGSYLEVDANLVEAEYMYSSLLTDSEMFELKLH